MIRIFFIAKLLLVSYLLCAQSPGPGGLSRPIQAIRKAPRQQAAPGGGNNQQTNALQLPGSNAYSAKPMVRNCFTVESEMKLQKKFSGRLSNEQFEQRLQQLLAVSSWPDDPVVYQIPVIVHIIHNGEPVGVGTNLSQAQVNSQFDALNEDFRRLGAGYNEHPAGADVQIEFVPALFDPQGNKLKEPGIDRQFGYESNYNYDIIEFELKPNTIWNPDQYFNIWTVNFGGDQSFTLGYAQFPSLSGLEGLPESGSAETDGVVIGYQYFGRTANVQAPFNLGRTTTHEVGHWLGLRHIWGDGDCSVDDYCADTPNADGPNHTCVVRDSCPEDGPDMIENYMDYSDDACMNIFTADQRSRIRAVMQLSPRRNTLVACQRAELSVAGINITSSPRHWFEYTATGNEVVLVSSVGTASVDTRVTLFQQCNSLPVFVSDNAHGSSQSAASVTLEPGETVKILWENRETEDPFEWKLSVQEPVTGASCKLAMAAQEGTNAVPIPAAEQEIYWFSYTPDASVKIHLDGGGHPYSVYSNTCDNLQHVASGDSQLSVYEVQAGETIFIAFDVNDGDFTWQLSTDSYRTGETCADASVALSGQNIVPYAPPFQYWYTYTMPFNGELKAFTPESDGFTRLALYGSCQRHDVLPTAARLKQGDVVKILVDGDRSVGSVEWYLEATEFLNGEECSAAVQAEAGINHTSQPTQWFTYTTTRLSNLRISSVGFTDVNTHLIVKHSCDGQIVEDSDDTFVNGIFSSQSRLVLHNVPPGETFLIGWTEKWSLEGFDWMIEEAAITPGDHCTTAKDAITGVNLVDLDPSSDYFGDIYWTKFIVPAAGLKIKAFADAPVDMAIYQHDNCQTFNFVNGGDGLGQAFNLPAGTELLILWSAEYFIEDFSWTLSVEEIEDGDLCRRPGRASIGTNTAPYSPFYFEYVMTQPGSLRLTAQAGSESAVVNVSTGCSIDDLLFAGYGEALVSGLKQGDRVLITWATDYPYSGIVWTLEEIAHQTGDTCQDPLTANYGINQASYATSWYRYHVATTGRLKISSLAFTQTDTDLAVYDGCGGNLLAASDNVWSEEDFSLYFQSEVGIDVEEGQILLIRWGGQYSFNSFTWEIVDDAPRRGDTCADPLPAQIGVNNALKQSPSWYTFTMPRTASLTLSSLGIADASTAIDVYDACDGNLLASDDGSDGSAQTYLHLPELTEGQTVLIKCYGTIGSRFSTYDWNLIVGEPTPGLFCQFPAQAVEGINTTPAYASENYWYAFTMPASDKKLVVSRVSSPAFFYRNVGVTGDCAQDLVYGVSEDQLEITGLLEGEQVLIFWGYNITGERPPTEWRLEVLDFEIGDSCDSPQPALPGTNDCTGAATWYLYTMPRTGDLRLSSLGEVFYADTYVDVYDACGGTLLASNDNINGDLQSEVVLENVLMGSELLIRWATNHPFQTPFQWQLIPEGVVNSIPVLETTYFDLPSSATAGHILGELAANDPDGDELYYQIKSGNDVDAFSLTADGVLSVAHPKNLPPAGAQGDLIVSVTDWLSITEARVIVSLVTSVSDEQKHRLQIFPNPATDRTYLQVPRDWSDFSVEIIDATGHVVRRFAQSTHDLTMEGLASGVYYISVRSIHGRLYDRLVVVR